MELCLFSQESHGRPHLHDPTASKDSLLALALGMEVTAPCAPGRPCWLWCLAL